MWSLLLRTVTVGGGSYHFCCITEIFSRSIFSCDYMEVELKIQHYLCMHVFILHVFTTLFRHFLFLDSKRAKNISSSVPNNWPCDVTLSHENTRLSGFVEVMCTMKHEWLTLIGGGSYDSKCYVARGMGGTRFAMMRYKGWMGGQMTNVRVT